MVLLSRGCSSVRVSLWSLWGCKSLGLLLPFSRFWYYLTDYSILQLVRSTTRWLLFSYTKFFQSKQPMTTFQFIVLVCLDWYPKSSYSRQRCHHPCLRVNLSELFPCPPLLNLSPSYLLRNLLNILLFVSLQNHRLPPVPQFLPKIKLSKQSKFHHYNSDNHTVTLTR